MRAKDLFALVDTDLDTLGQGDRQPGVVRKLPIPGLSSEDIETLKFQGNPVAALAGETTAKSYVTLHRHSNVTSNSILDNLHACPRLFILEKLQANSDTTLGVTRPLNLDFVFGHAVGAGVAAYLAFDCNLPYGLFATFVSWYGPFDFGKEDYHDKKKKSIERACIAVEMFAAWWRNSGFEDEWEIYRLPDGRPAVELSFCIDLGTTRYFGHIDLILRNRRTGRIAIGENKTTGFTNPHPAIYQNSGQALGYALVLDAVVGELADYDVLYYAFSSRGEEWFHFPFAKTTATKLEWIQDRLIDAGHIQQYFKLEHFPKDGRSCFRFNRTCQFFGECDLVSKERIRDLPFLSAEDKESYPVDYYFDIQQLVQEQARKGLM